MTRRHFRNFVFFPLSALTLIIVMIWAATPFVAKHYISQYFEEQGQDISIGSLSIDFFPPKIDLKNVTIKNATQDTLTLKRATFGIEALPLIARTVRLSHANIDGFSVWVAQQENDWIVAGINTAQYLQNDESEEALQTNTEQETEIEPTSEPWKISLPKFTFTDSQLHLSRQPEASIPAQTDRFTISNLTVKDLSGKALEWTGSVALSALINQSTLSIATQFDYSPERSSANISIEKTKISIDDLRHFLPSPFHTGEGQLAINGELNVLQTQVEGAPVFKVNDLNMKTEITALDLAINEQDKITTTSTILDLTEANLEFVSADQLTFTGKTALTSNQFAFTQANLIAQYDNLALTLPIDIKRDELGLAAQITNTQLDIADLSVVLDRQNNNTNKEAKEAGQKDAFQAEEKRLSLGAFKFTTDQLNVEIKDGQDPAVRGENLNIATQSLDSMLGDKKRIAAWKNADINALSFSQQGEQFDVAFEQINIANITLSEILPETDSKLTLPILGQINNIKIDTLSANQDGSRISAITTDSVKINLILNAQKRLENLVSIQENPQAALQPSLQDSNAPKAQDAENAINNAPNTEEKPAFKAPYYVILDAYDMTGESQIHVQDRSITPALQRSLDIDSLSLRNLNTQDKEQATEFTLKARNGKYATLSSDITIWPLADKLTMKSDLVIREAELPPYSSYIANALGYQIDSGQLDLDLTLNADNGELDGNSHILLREFDLGGKKESSSVIKAGAVPLNIAVGILKDSDNNIDLDIPLSGDIENPEFGWQSFMILPVRKALFKASSSYLMQTFVPYASVISIAQLAGDQLLKIRVEPLLFEAEESRLNDAQDVFLKQLTALMKDKEDSKLKACGVASYLDLGLEEPPASIDSATRGEAQKLAQERSNILKDYLVKEGISSSRIFLCSPEVDLSKSSQPRIELNF
ncbi:hypothetical protein MUS1_11045 [Marinomonas ushuaiensis DSM 15871]|uniref:OmpA-like domain-containing protein n=1 Tax=Marinomonas ushuaiensis DSM 15871 TaxID=1122207 RepID=X7E8C1_9GAMM|nr:DUF748 domain-containing protein [Marinomonas ushuaiensis]ETX11406.1 hypothetical protein MUS1_11045 [Marinomonas ushuaiensis DSM 15871]